VHFGHTFFREQNTYYYITEGTVWKAEYMVQLPGNKDTDTQDLDKQ